jgi:hypothetical protein
MGVVGSCIKRLKTIWKLIASQLPLSSRALQNIVFAGESDMSDPEFLFGRGRHQISLKGREAIREGGWAIRLLLVARALAISLPVLAAVIALVMWHFG